MNFTLRILGTASAMPVNDRRQSAHVLDVHGRFFLIDCGEGVQNQMVRYKMSFQKVDSIFISHIHGDHVFGLFGFLSTVGMLGRTAPIRIYGPSNLGPIIKFFLSYYGEGLHFDVKFQPLDPKEPEVIYSTKSFEVLAFPLNHKIATCGYIFREKRPLMNVRKEKIEKYGFSIQEIGAIKKGEDIVRPEGVIPNSEVAYLPYEPRSYAYCSDTATFKSLSEWVKGVDLLYHETTYLKSLPDQALLRHHSTTEQAARCALEAGVGKLVIGHYSSRCRNKSLYEKECMEIFPETYAADDGDVFDIPRIVPSASL